MMIWQDRNMLECFKVFEKVFYVKLYVHSLVDKLKWFYENARCYNKIYIAMFVWKLVYFLKVFDKVRLCSVDICFVV